MSSLPFSLSEEYLPTVFGFKSKLLQLLGSGLIWLFSILRLLDFQGMRFLCGNFSIGFRHVVVFIEVLSAGVRHRR